MALNELHTIAHILRSDMFAMFSLPSMKTSIPS